MSSMKVKGLDGLQSSLKGLVENAENLSKEKSIPIDKILTKSFISKNTPYSDFNEFMKESGFTAKTQEDFDAIDNSKLDSFVSTNTKFSSFQEMINVAGEKYAKNSLKI